MFTDFLISCFRFLGQGFFKMADAKLSLFSQRVIELVGSIPYGRVSSYGDIACAAESPRGARQVVRVLHSLSRKYKLPWHRVVNRKGEVASCPEIFDEQIQLLAAEGVDATSGTVSEFERYRFRPLVIDNK